MPDWNLALIDVATAWVVVALPCYVQAKLLASGGVYSPEALRALAIDERLSIDPVKHTGVLGTLLVPAATSLAGFSVVAWGKRIESVHLGKFRLATQLWLAPSIVYLLQACLFAAAMALLSRVYLEGAPVAARAGQLCLRLAILNLLPLPLLDSGLSIAAWSRHPLPPRWVLALVSMAALAGLYATGMLRAIDQQVMLAFFMLSRLFI
ncbi:MAG: hypothetical protein KIT83_20880 [Bryobacterales bacterium]|nr:hypothetical protein [Bryobacterales bacterium]